MIVPCVAHFIVPFAIQQIQFHAANAEEQRRLRRVFSLRPLREMYLSIRITTVEVWLSSYLPLEDMIANYPPRRMQQTMIVALQLVKKNITQ